MTNNVLKLTGIIQPGLGKGVFVGRIKEISGIVSQGRSEQEAFDNLVSIVPIMLDNKKEEAKRLLESQNAPRSQSQDNDTFEFSLKLTKELHEA